MICTLLEEPSSHPRDPNPWGGGNHRLFLLFYFQKQWVNSFFYWCVILKYLHSFFLQKTIWKAMDQGPIILTEHLNTNGVKQKWQYFTTVTFWRTIPRGKPIYFWKCLNTLYLSPAGTFLLLHSVQRIKTHCLSYENQYFDRKLLQGRAKKLPGAEEKRIRKTVLKCMWKMKQ